MNQNKKFFVYPILVFLLTTFVVYVFYPRPIYGEFDLKVKVDNHTVLGGRSLNLVDFGVLNKNCKAESEFLVQNTSPFFVKHVKCFLVGNITKVAYLKDEDKNFTLNPFEKKIVVVYVKPVVKGFFEGKLVVREIP